MLWWIRQRDEFDRNLDQLDVETKNMGQLSFSSNLIGCIWNRYLPWLDNSQYIILPLLKQAFRYPGGVSSVPPRRFWKASFLPLCVIGIARQRINPVYQPEYNISHLNLIYKIFSLFILEGNLVRIKIRHSRIDRKSFSSYLRVFVWWLKIWYYCRQRSR